MNPHEKNLILLLRITASACMLAIFPVFFPYSWMNIIHDQWLGMGSLPDIAIVSYLSRSLSLFYAASGWFIYYLTLDIKKHKPLLKIGLYISILFGILTLYIDMISPMPFYWKIGEPIILLTISLLCLYWLKKVD